MAGDLEHGAGMARNGLAMSYRDAEPIDKIRFNPKAQLDV